MAKYFHRVSVEGQGSGAFVTVGRWVCPRLIQPSLAEVTGCSPGHAKEIVAVSR